MKRKIIYSALACGLAVTLGGAALASSADESLISRSYLEGTFLQELTQEIGDWVDAAFSPIYDDAQDELDRIGQGYLSSLDSPAVPIPEGWSGSDQFVAQTGRAGDTVTLKPGSGIYWNSGSASVRVTENTVIVEDISFTGPTSVSGSAEISPSAMRLVRARLLVKAPPELDRMFEMLRMTNMLPLKKVKEGEWRIER